MRQPVVTPTQHNAPSEQRRGPVLALAAVAVAVALAIGGASYWWLSDGDEPAQPPAAVVPKVTPPVAVAEVDGGQRPLLMAGKKTLFQRVLSKPGAQLSADAGSSPGKALPAFSVLYVYQRKDVDGSPWVRVGAATDGRSDGWLPASQVSDWKQSLVLKFTERSGRAPVMFLRQPAEVEKLLADPAAAKSVLAKAQSNRENNQQVLALEPTASAVPQNQFYLLPIFDSKESFDDNGQPVQLLNVASIDPGSSAAAKPASPTLSAHADAFRTAVVLVVDTTVSMQPYIDQIRDVVHELQTRIAERGELDSVSFGMVGFRSSIQKTLALSMSPRPSLPSTKAAIRNAFWIWRARSKRRRCPATRSTKMRLPG